MLKNQFKGVLKRYLILLLITLVIISGFFYGTFKDKNNPIIEKLSSEINKEP